MTKWAVVRQVSLVAVLGGAVLAATMASSRRSGDQTFFDPIIDVRKLIEERYVDEVDEKKLQDGAIAGMVEALNDPYTVYVPAEHTKRFEKDLTGEYSGIGAQVNINQGWLTIVTPLEDSPAFKMGIMPDDRVVEIEGKSTFGLDVDECVDILTGKEGTPVNLVIERAGQKIPFTITRQKIKTRSVKGFHRDQADTTTWQYLVDEPRGLVLATGPTGQGKSTTVRALIQELNESRGLRIVTVEDPIEYVFEDARSHFEQREVGIDTGSFADGIRNAMRQDPNVIFVGELRDRDSIWACMQAAETGHLVVSTLHADSVAQAVARVREFYPADEQGSVAAMLARNLVAIVNQRLIPNRGGTRTPCLEILRRDAGVQEAIRENNLHLLHGIIEASVHVGMHTFDQYLVELLAGGIIDESTARRYAVHRHALDMQLRGIQQPQAILRPERDR